MVQFGKTMGSNGTGAGFKAQYINCLRLCCNVVAEKIHCEHDQTRSSLIWVYTVYNIGYQTTLNR